MVFVWIVLALAAAYLLFIVAPATVAFFFVFGRKKEPKPDFERFVRLYGEKNVQVVTESEKYYHTLTPENVTVTAPDGAVLSGEYFENGGTRTVICFHGYNATPVMNFAYHGKIFLAEGYNVLWVWQRGCGESGGKRIGMGLLERYDVSLWVEKARALCPGTQIVLYGVSMGAATIAYASDVLAGSDILALIIDCGYTSPYVQLTKECKMRRMPAWGMMPVVNLCSRIVLRQNLRHSVTEHLRNTTIPAFFLHGGSDLTVPVSQSRESFAATASPKAFLLIKDAKHTTAFVTGGEDAARDIFEFIDWCGEYKARENMI